MRFPILLALVVATGCASRRPEPYSRAGLVQAMRANLPPERYEALLDAIYKGMAASRPDGLEQVSVPALKELTRSVMSYEEVLEWSADAYEKNFTPAELQDLIAFYRSPVGIKVGERTPQLIGDLMQRLVAEMKPRLQRILRERKAPKPSG
jgi:uncharacterized protein